MGLLSNKISRDSLKAGDHIYSWRSYVYAHHGIYIGDGKVIHFTRGGGLEIGTGTFVDKFLEISVPRPRGFRPCLDCGDQSNLFGVISSCLDCFLAGGNLYLFEYNVSKPFFVAKNRGGTCTVAPSDSSDEVISRAKFLLFRNGFGDYDLLHNNCEDFAIYCKTGLAVLSVTKLGCSGQINSISAAGGFVSSTLNVLGNGKIGQAASLAATASMVSAATNVVSAATNVVSRTASMVSGYVVICYAAKALVGYGKYCADRLSYDIGVRSDARKIPVEEYVEIIAAKEVQLDNNKDNNKCQTS